MSDERHCVNDEARVRSSELGPAPPGFVLALLLATLAPSTLRAQNEVEVEVGPGPLCLQWLGEHHVQFTSAPPTHGIRTPIEVPGPIGSVTLFLRAHGATLHRRMDCELARALVEAAPIFRELKITDLVYSAAYDYRTRRGSTTLSGHASGLAIDVHAFNGPERSYSVEQDFETGAGEWLTLPRVGASLESCVGQPRTDAGRTLRTLACRLKLNPAFRVIVTRDDDEDHRDHFHLEAYPDLAAKTRSKRYTAAAHPPAIAPAPNEELRQKKGAHRRTQERKTKSKTSVKAKKHHKTTHAN